MFKKESWLACGAKDKGIAKMDERSIIRGAEWRNARHEGSKGPPGGGGGPEKREGRARGWNKWWPDGVGYRV